MCEKLGIQKTRTTPYRPQSDGLVERYNRTLQQMLASYANEHRNNWDENVPFVLMAYRCTIQESTGCSPNLLMFGHEINTPIDLILGNPNNAVSPSCPIEYVEWLRNVLTETFDFVNKNLKQAAERQKKYYDRGLKPREFSSEDFVWRWYPPTAGVKLGLGWVGPYKVIDKVTDVTYKIQKSPNNDYIVVHVDQLKPYEGILPPLNWVPQTSFTEESVFDHVPMERELDSEEDFTPITSTPFPDPNPVIKRSRVGRRIKPRDIYSS